MSPIEFEQHIGGAVNAALKSGVNPTVIVTVLEGTKLEVLMMLKRQAQEARQQSEEAANKPSRIVGLDGESIAGN